MAEIERLNTALEGRYRIVRELGRGGMATVYLAEDLRHPRQVAVKVLRPDLAAALGGDRFLREIEISARLEHPHVLTLIDSGQADEILYYVMPYVEGESLRARVEREGALPVDDAVRILKEVVDALAYAHSKGIVHRDIKPDNVLLSGRHAEVTDFGVAKALSEAAHESDAITSTGMAMGTPSYMAPEQAAAEPNVDHRADIYAVGVMAYELLAGRAPFVGATAQQVLAAHMTETPDPLDKHRANLPPGLAECVDRCLEKNPADRWQSAEELLRQLETVTTPSLGTIPIPLVRRTSKPKTRIVALGATVILVAAVGWFGRSWFGGSPGVVVDPQAVAVMPFRSRGADPALGYLREGVVDLFDARLTGGGGLPDGDQPLEPGRRLRRPRHLRTGRGGARRPAGRRPVDPRRDRGRGLGLRTQRVAHLGAGRAGVGQRQRDGAARQRGVHGGSVGGDAPGATGRGS